MKINNKSITTDAIFNIEEGDIFLFNDHYYIAGEIDWHSHMRVCYDLTINREKKFTNNEAVVAWDKNTCELILR